MTQDSTNLALELLFRQGLAADVQSRECPLKAAQVLIQVPLSRIRPETTIPFGTLVFFQRGGGGDQPVIGVRKREEEDQGEGGKQDGGRG